MRADARSPDTWRPTYCGCFGWIMFCSSQGDSCPKQLVPLARAIADASLDDVPQFSWGSTVLAATYRGLCTGVTKVSADEPIFVGCPLLLQLWSYERFFPSVGQRWTSSRTSSCRTITTTSTDLRWVRCGVSGRYVISFVLLIVTCVHNCTI